MGLLDLVDADLVLGSLWPKERCIAGILVSHKVRVLLQKNALRVLLKARVQCRKDAASTMSEFKTQLKDLVRRTLRQFSRDRLEISLDCAWSQAYVAESVFDGLSDCVRDPEWRGRVVSMDLTQCGFDSPPSSFLQLECPHLTSLELQQNYIGNRALEKLVPMLSRCTRLQHLGLSRNDIQESTALAAVVEQTQSLTHLDLGLNDLEARAVKLLVGLQRCSSLQILDLKRNFVCTATESVRVLCTLLRASSTLSDLNLWRCAVRHPHDAASLAAALAASPSLTSLELGGGGHGAEMVGAYCKVASSSALQALSLRQAQLGEEAATAIAGAAAGGGLRRLDLRENGLSSEAQEQLCIALQHSPIELLLQPQ